MEKISYAEFKRRMREHNENTKNWSSDCISGVIVFTEDSFLESYSLESRSYIVSSDNKVFIPHMSGYSIYGSSIDGTDKYVKLTNYIDVELGGKNGWHVDYCYMIEE